MPNTNNAIESLNADLKTKLNLHKGEQYGKKKELHLRLYKVPFY
jgi:transposase-like protein